MPRRRTITPKVLTDLFAWIADGKTLSAFCRERKVSRTQVHERLQEAVESERLARARAIGTLVHEDEILEIADTPMLVEVKNGEVEALIVHPDDVRARALRIAAREKLLVWNNPGKYGQKAQVQVDHTHRIELSDDERTRRIAELQEKARVRVEIGEPQDEHKESA